MAARTLSAGELKALVSLLGDDDRWVSDQARRHLIEAGEAAVAHLQAAVDGADPRLAARARGLLDDLRFEPLRRALHACARSGNDASALERGAFLIAEHAYPELDASAYRARLDAMAAAVAQRPCGSRREAMASLKRHLFEEVGLRGNEADYFNPENSYLNRVIDRGLGIPISLSAIYILVAARLGFPVRGVALPGHFIAGWFADGEATFVDPFRRGRELSVGDCARLAESAGASFHHGLLRPAPTALILVRMLTNLVNIHQSAGDAERVRRLLALRDAAAGRGREGSA